MIKTRPADWFPGPLSVQYRARGLARQQVTPIGLAYTGKLPGEAGPLRLGHCRVGDLRNQGLHALPELTGGWVLLAGAQGDHEGIGEIVHGVGYGRKAEIA